MNDSEKVCVNCKYNYGEYTCDIKDKEMHCLHCSADDKGGFTRFLDKRCEYPPTKCKDCSFYRVKISEAPCCSCLDYSKFKDIASPHPRRKSKQIESSEPVFIVDDIESSANQDSPTSETSETGADKIKEMISTAVNNFHFSLDPCKMCKYESDENTCKSCCYYYASEFELKEVK